MGLSSFYDLSMDAAKLNQFLASVERRAFAMVMMSVKNPDDALDIVQDVMLTLARKYADKPEAEWPPLFFKILKNKVTDFHRGSSVRARFFWWISGDDDETDPIQSAPGPDDFEPEVQVAHDASVEEISAAVEELPERQQEAFMYRAWQGLSTSETAQAMGCSEGSVKTHYSRAISALRSSLGDAT